MLEGCQGKQEISIEVRNCPNCGEEVEIFSIDTEVTCENCGFVIYNDKLSCVQWCQYAEECVGPERYKQLMEVARAQQERHAQEAAEQRNAETA